MNNEREGWLGEDYVRIYATSDRSRIAKLYEFETLLPGYEPWGSWGLDALCLGPDARLYAIDWIPLHEEFRKERYESVTAFEDDIGRLNEATQSYEHFRKEVHFVKPIAFGGDPKEAPVMVDQSAHAELCRFWNRTYARLKRKCLTWT
jgi:hypothetical protein